MLKKIKRITGVMTALILALSSLTAFAGDNKSLYQSFINSVVLPQSGICDFEKSYAGVQGVEVNDYFSGLISAFTIDLNGDNNDELVVVESNLISVYDVENGNVVFVDDRGQKLIGEHGDSFTNIFIKTSYIEDENGKGGFKNFLCIENCAGDDAKKDYKFTSYIMNTERHELQEMVSVQKSVDNGSRFEAVMMNGVSLYSYSGGEVTSVYNPKGYAKFYDAVHDALASIKIDASLFRSYNRLWFWESDRDTQGMTKEEISKADFIRSNSKYSAKEIIPDAFMKTYIRSTNVNTQYRPVVVFEDYSILKELVKPVDNIKVKIDGEELTFKEQAPVMVDNRVLVPMRAIFEKLGADVQWLASSRKVVANTDTKNITMTIGDKVYYLNGEKKELDVPPQVLNDRTVVPIRAVSEALDCKVSWDQENLTVLISTK